MSRGRCGVGWCCWRNCLPSGVMEATTFCESATLIQRGGMWERVGVQVDLSRPEADHERRAGGLDGGFREEKRQSLALNASPGASIHAANQDLVCASKALSSRMVGRISHEVVSEGNQMIYLHS